MDPRVEYARRLEQRRKVLSRYTRWDLTFAIFRGFVFLAGVMVLLIPSLRWWALIPAACFIVLMVLHEKVLQQKARAAKAVAFYERAIARLNDDWIGHGNTGAKFQQDTHLYTNDLDIFGHGSLYELLCLAQTQSGEDTLANWLKSPAPPETVKARQQAVEELRRKMDFREDLVMTGSGVRTDLHPEVPAKWAEQTVIRFSLSLRATVAAVALGAVASLIAWGMYHLPSLPFFIFAAIEIFISRMLRQRVHQITEGAEQAAPELRILSRVLERIESETFASGRLKSLLIALDTEGLRPSRQIARLGKMLELADSARNQFFAPIAALLMWRVQIAFALESWRAHCGPKIRGWMETVGEMEALCSLACFAFEHPGDPFPEISEEGPRFEASGLGHPLIPEKRCVRNDISIHPQTRLFIVSGSNMSGKSTLLRSIGINTVLAFAGATVRTSTLKLSPASVGASIRVVDSLQEGTSRFYAEIKRLRQLMDLANQTTLLFLLDEILHGTNSVDRAAGAEAIVRGFLERGAMGLITTHDLALTQIADRLSPAAVNVHFEDQIENGQVLFDYRLRSGVVQKSNAIALMRSVGLNV